LLPIAITAALAFGAALRGADTPDAAFRRFWDARSPQDASKTIDAILKSGVTFDDAYAHLRQGRPYRPDVQRGVFQQERRTTAGDFFYTVDVPESYDPGHAWPVRIQLHGGVMMRDSGTPRPGAGGAPNKSLRGAEQFYVMPTSWRDAPWWSDAQIDNLRAILDTLERVYNIDENRIALSGVSDGATASYYFAMRDTTPYASFESLNGSLKVLANPALDIRGDLYPNNLLNKPIFAVNGALDPLYPAGAVAPYLDRLKQSGVDVEFHARIDGVHNTAWWPDVKDTFERFVSAHPRAPFPDRLTWETERGGVRSRAHWLVIDRLGTARSEPPQDGEVTPLATLFPRSHPSGRVDLVRRGNRVEAATRNVTEFTLLLSPEVFDFSQPVQVIANGRTVFDGTVERSLPALLKWAAADNDRTMLIGAELHITLR
jgi:predicted esterase